MIINCTVNVFDRCQTSDFLVFLSILINCTFQWIFSFIYIVEIPGIIFSRIFSYSFNGFKSCSKIYYTVSNIGYFCERVFSPFLMFVSLAISSAILLLCVLIPVLYFAVLLVLHSLGFTFLQFSYLPGGICTCSLVSKGEVGWL